MRLVCSKNDVLLIKLMRINTSYPPRKYIVCKSRNVLQVEIYNDALAVNAVK